MSKIAVKLLTGLALGLLTGSYAAPVKVDLSRSGRNDTRAPRFIEWQVDSPRATTNIGPLSFTLRKAGGDGRSIEGGLYKFGIDYGARLACDAIVLRNADSSSGLELVISGLSPGPHTIATFHNSTFSSEQRPSKLDLFVNGNLAITNIQPTVQVTNDYECASAFVRVEAVAGKDLVLKFADANKSTGDIFLNGFEIDCSDPAARAIKPVPDNADEHVEVTQGSAKLRWTGGSSSVSHDLYFGTDSEAVGQAARNSPLFKGNLKETAFVIDRLNHFDSYFWRVDEIDRSGKITQGEVWTFRTRHLAFPSAEGYGRFSRGGRGGRVITVTNLNDSGPGTLRAAVEAEGPRTVIFDVSGLITLESKLLIKNPYLTIAGQTAPGNGVCIRKFNLGMMGTHDVIVRYVRVRPGNISGTTLDGMGMASSDHCIIDHCSISWTLDEAFSSRSAKNITLQRTLISEALNEAGHKKYPPGTQHGYAASIGGMIGSFHHNLLAHCAGRNWSLAGGLNQGAQHTGWLDIRNNVVYNWKHRTTDGGAAKVNYVNNYYKPGPATAYFNLLNPERNNIKGYGPQNYFIAGNVMEGRHRADQALSGVTQPEPYKNFVVDQPFFESFVQTHGAEETYTNVLADVGCNYPKLDAHDLRVIQEVRGGTSTFRGSKTGLAGLPDSQEDVGGWENYPVVQRPANWDTDGDGMPNQWEESKGLDPMNSQDGNRDRDGDGYTNLEEYLGSLTGEFKSR